MFGYKRDLAEGLLKMRWYKEGTSEMGFNILILGRNFKTCMLLSASRHKAQSCITCMHSTPNNTA